MKIIALEEHYATPDLMAAWHAIPLHRQDLATRLSSRPDLQARLYDMADDRITAMDAAGVDVQVLSLPPPGAQNFEPAEAVARARDANDRLADLVRTRPNRFAGLATLPMAAPDEAARELERAVRVLGLDGAMLHGGIPGKMLDHPDFLPVFEAAAALRAPIYLHPSTPPKPVRDAYYHGLGEPMESVLATAGLGWHYEAGLHALRLVLAGTLDRFPDLPLILGHWGEVVLFYLERADDVLARPSGLARPVSEYFRSNVWVSPSGMFSKRYLRWAVEVLGADKLLFSTDYPYHLVGEGGARDFVSGCDLSVADAEGFAHRNWETLVGKIRR